MEATKCQFCAEEIMPEAIKCKHCGSMLDGSDSQPQQVQVDPRVAKGKTLICQQCGGEMKKKRKAKHSQILALLFFVIGLILTVTLIAWFIGLPLMLISLFMMVGTKKFWKCTNCGAIVERA